MITTVQLEECETVWNNILKRELIVYPFYTYGWHIVWKKTLAPTSRVLVYHTDDVLVSLVITDNEAHFSGGEEIADYLDCVGETSKKQLFWEELLSYLKNQGVNRILLRNIPASSPTKNILQTLGGMATTEDMTPTIPLPKTEAEYFQSLDRKNRHEFKRKIKKFELSYPDINFWVTKKVNINALLTLMKQADNKKIFLTHDMDQFFRSLPTLPNIQILQANLSTNDGTLVASVILFVTNRTLLLYNSGFDDSYQGSGFYLKAKMILWGMENNYKEYNFLQGQERYKYELGGKDVPVYRITVHAAVPMSP